MMHWLILNNGGNLGNLCMIFRLSELNGIKKNQLYEQEGYSEREALNIRTEEQKLTDIEFLKNKILLAVSLDLTKFPIT